MKILSNFVDIDEDRILQILNLKVRVKYVTVYVKISTFHVCICFYSFQLHHHCDCYIHIVQRGSSVKLLSDLVNNFSNLQNVYSKSTKKRWKKRGEMRITQDEVHWLIDRPARNLHAYRMRHGAYSPMFFPVPLTANHTSVVLLIQRVNCSRLKSRIPVTQTAN